MRGADEIAKVEITPRSLKKIFSSETRNSILLLNQMVPQRRHSQLTTQPPSEYHSSLANVDGVGGLGEMAMTLPCATTGKRDSEIGRAHV